MVTASGIDEAAEKKKKQKEIQALQQAKQVKIAQGATTSPAKSSGAASGMMSALSSGAGGGGTDSVSSVGEGAAQGFAAGGPWGAVAGAALGLLKAEGAKKQARTKAKSDSMMQVGELKRRQGDKESDILGGLMNNLRQTMIF